MKIIKPLTLSEFIQSYQVIVRDEKNKMILMYGMHEPFEPTSIIIESLNLPDNVIALKHPFENTPRGVYIEIGKKAETILLNDIDKEKFRECYDDMSKSFNKDEYSGKIGDVYTKHPLDYKIVTDRFLISEFDLVKSVKDKKVLTMLIHGDTDIETCRYFIHFNANRYNTNLFSCKLPTKWDRCASFNIDTSTMETNHLELEICFPHKGVLRDFETNISENDKCNLYKGLSLLGRYIYDINEQEKPQHSWTYASQSYNLQKLDDKWIKKRIEVLNKLLIQF